MLSPRRRPACRLCAALAFVALLAAAPSGPADADSGLTISTPYPSIATQPGSTVKFDVSVSASVTESVDLDVPSLPDGWTATLRGGGFVIQSVTATPDQAGSVTLEVAVPPDANRRRVPDRARPAPTASTHGELAMRLMRAGAGRHRHPADRRLPVVAAATRNGDFTLHAHDHQQHAGGADVHVRARRRRRVGRSTASPTAEAKAADGDDRGRSDEQRQGDGDAARRRRRRARTRST